MLNTNDSERQRTNPNFVMKRTDEAIQVHYTPANDIRNVRWIDVMFLIKKLAIIGNYYFPRSN